MDTILYGLAWIAAIIWIAINFVIVLIPVCIVAFVVSLFSNDDPEWLNSAGSRH